MLAMISSGLRPGASLPRLPVAEPPQKLGGGAARWRPRFRDRWSAAALSGTAVTGPDVEPDVQPTRRGHKARRASTVRWCAPDEQGGLS